MAGRRLRALAIRVAPGAADLAGDLAGRFLVLVTGGRDARRRPRGPRRGPGRPPRPRPGDAVRRWCSPPTGPCCGSASLDVGEDALADGAGHRGRRARRAPGWTTPTSRCSSPPARSTASTACPAPRCCACSPTPAGPDGALPPAWLEVAAEWVLGDATADEPVAVRLLGAPFTVRRPRRAGRRCTPPAAARTWCDLVQGDLDRRDPHGVAHLRPRPAPRPRRRRAGLRHRRRCSPASTCSCDVARDVGPRPPTRASTSRRPSTGSAPGSPAPAGPPDGGAAPNAVAGQVGDVVVPGRVPVPGARARPPRPPAGPVATSDLDGEAARRRSPRGRPRRARRLAARASSDASDAVEQGRRRCRTCSSPTPSSPSSLAGAPARRAATAPSPSGTPRRRPGPRRRHARRASPTPAVACASRSSSSPPGSATSRTATCRAASRPCSPAYARWLAAGLDRRPRARQLKPYAARLVGTRGPGLRRGAVAAAAAGGRGAGPGWPPTGWPASRRRRGCGPPGSTPSPRGSEGPPRWRRQPPRPPAGPARRRAWPSSARLGADRRRPTRRGTAWERGLRGQRLGGRLRGGVDGDPRRRRVRHRAAACEGTRRGRRAGRDVRRAPSRRTSGLPPAPRPRRPGGWRERPPPRAVDARMADPTPTRGGGGRAAGHRLGPRVARRRLPARPEPRRRRAVDRGGGGRRQAPARRPRRGRRPARRRARTWRTAPPRPATAVRCGARGRSSPTASSATITWDAAQVAAAEVVDRVVLQRAGRSSSGRCWWRSPARPAAWPPATAVAPRWRRRRSSRRSTSSAPPPSSCSTPSSRSARQLAD